MSFLTRAIRSIPRTSVLSSSVPARSFHVTTFRAALSETDRHRDDEETKEHIETHKQDQLQKQKEGKGHWKQELASQSEAALAADKEDVEHTEDTIEKLQKETQHVAGKTDS
ncbi:hypothetical protein MMC25_004975 [Agyrium rufum]|nr:hypothetical protein [Agyrium rufum]